MALADAYLQWADHDKFERSITPKYLTVDFQDSGDYVGILGSSLFHGVASSADGIKSCVESMSVSQHSKL